MRSEEEILKERDIARELIRRIKKRLSEDGRNYGFEEVKDITKVIDPIYDLNPWEQWSYMNGVIHSRLAALDWVLGEIDGIEDYD